MGLYVDDMTNRFRSRSRSGGGCGGDASAYEEVMVALEASRKYHKLMHTLNDIRNSVEKGIDGVMALYDTVWLRLGRH